MIFKLIDKGDVMNMLEDGDLYLIRVSTKGERGRYCSSKQVSSLTVKEVMNAIKDNDSAFIQITKEERP